MWHGFSWKYYSMSFPAKNRREFGSNPHQFHVFYPGFIRFPCWNMTWISDKFKSWWDFHRIWSHFRTKPNCRQKVMRKSVSHFLQGLLVFASLGNYSKNPIFMKFLHFFRLNWLVNKIIEWQKVKSSFISYNIKSSHLKISDLIVNLWQVISQTHHEIIYACPFSATASISYLVCT